MSSFVFHSFWQLGTNSSNGKEKLNYNRPTRHLSEKHWMFLLVLIQDNIQQFEGSLATVRKMAHTHGNLGTQGIRTIELPTDGHHHALPLVKHHGDKAWKPNTGRPFLVVNTKFLCTHGLVFSRSGLISLEANLVSKVQLTLWRLNTALRGCSRWESEWGGS